MAMSKLFISHSSQDDGFVRELRMALELHGQDGWVDSRELRGGKPLWPEIQKAIEDAAACAVGVSPDGLQSRRVGVALAHVCSNERNQKRLGRSRGVSAQRFGPPRLHRET